MFLEEGLPHNCIELVLHSVAILSGLEQAILDVGVLTGGGLKRHLLHREGVRFIAGLLDLIEKLLFVALTLIEDVGLDLQARFDVLQAALCLHEL